MASAQQQHKRWRATGKAKPHRQRTCRGKVRYRDRSEALAALRTLEQVMADRPKRPRSMYECERCGGVHLTSQGPR